MKDFSSTDAMDVGQVPFNENFIYLEFNKTARIKNPPCKIYAKSVPAYHTLHISKWYQQAYIIWFFGTLEGLDGEKISQNLKAKKE